MTPKVPHLSRELREKAIKHFAVIYILVSFCESLLVFSVSVWILTQQTSALCLGFSQRYLPVYLSLAASCLLFLISIRGFVATQQKNKPKYFRYLAMTVVMVIILEIIAGISGAVFMVRIKGDEPSNKLKSAQENYFTDSSVKACWDRLQPIRKCCGTERFQDWRWLFDDVSWTNVSFPDSCRCEVQPGPGENSSKSCLEVPNENSTSPNSGVYQYGCRLTVQNDLNDMLVIIVAITFGFAVVQIVTSILSMFMVSRFANSSVVEVYVVEEGTVSDNPNLARLERSGTQTPSRPSTVDFTTRPSSGCSSSGQDQPHS